MRNSLDLEHGVVEMAHGSGGAASAELTVQLFLPAFAESGCDTSELAKSDDGAVLGAMSGEIVIATDSHVISPLFFSGGDIGCLSVFGSVNDVAVMGAMPKHLTVGFILEEGFPLADLQRIATSMGKAAKQCGVSIATADTKVVGRGQADGIYITTTCLGVREGSYRFDFSQVEQGDAVLVSGSIGDHGAAILLAREDLGLQGEICSDCQPVHGLVQHLLENGVKPKFMRDPTRGGLATVLHEVVTACGKGIAIEEKCIPVREQVRAVSELLGLDPLYFACEGRVVLVVKKADAEKAITLMNEHEAGTEAVIIGHVSDGQPMLVLETLLGAKRVMHRLSGDQLPRIC